MDTISESDVSANETKALGQGWVAISVPEFMSKVGKGCIPVLVSVQNGSEDGQKTVNPNPY